MTQTTHDPQWETTEHGWHAVAALCSKGYKWTAYIEYADAPYWRIWAGCMFESLDKAQEWCRAEISNQLERSEQQTRHRETASEISGLEVEPKAWQWFWNTLSEELGKDRTVALRTELAQRLREDKESSPLPPDCGTT